MFGIEGVNCWTESQNKVVEECRPQPGVQIFETFDLSVVPTRENDTPKLGECMALC